MAEPIKKREYMDWDRPPRRTQYPTIASNKYLEYYQDLLGQRIEALKQQQAEQMEENVFLRGPRGINWFDRNEQELNKLMEESDRLYWEAYDKIKASGVTPDLPEYETIVEGIYGPDWQQKYQKELAGQKATTQYQQSQFDEPFRKQEQEYQKKRAEAPGRQLEQTMAQHDARREAERQWVNQTNMATGEQYGQQLAGLQGPQNWVQRYIAEHSPPEMMEMSKGTPWYAMSPQDRGTSLALGRYGPETQKQLVSGFINRYGYDDWIEKAGKFGGLEETGGGPYEADYPSTPSEAWRRHWDVEPEEWSRMKAGTASTEGYDELTPEERFAKKVPKTPSWLAKMVPGLEADDPLRRMEITTPSISQWQGMLPSQKAQFGSYAAWSGRVKPGKTGLASAHPSAGNLRGPEDILAYMESMRPLGSVAGRKRWAPVRR